ncbi:MAG: hypothetical protein D6773_14795 [Alphaproteobacteria bacterium]|nr:MAG: hypothetical protein D6773_14795 [Alphaproteobacteria bacterium]
MIDQPAFMHSILDSEFYESIDAYEPDSGLLDLVRRHLPRDAGWSVYRGGYWTQASHESNVRMIQGWKIHLSASRKSARELLDRTVPIFARHRVGFKFLSDENIVAISLSKNAARTAAGKFVTVYPESEESFKVIIGEVYRATTDLRGPFLLTDRPYKDSKVVFYRYGEHYGVDRVDVHGRRVAGIQDPDGNWVSDERRPAFHLPSWIKDPFEGWEPVVKPKDGVVMLKDRYRVEKALRFHATGGIYRGVDTWTGEEVIIREARPVNRADGEDEEGFDLLRKEARILTKLGPLGVTARFVDLFQEWEHLFLVQERINADSLWGYSIGFSHGSSDIRPAYVVRRLRNAVKKIAIALKTVHDNGVVLRDLNRNNVMVTRDTEEVRFIDLEFAYELDRDDPVVPGYTEGYASPEQLANEKPHPGEDVYSLGALIVDMVAFTAPGLQLNRKGILDAFEMTLADYHLPTQLRRVADGLLEPDREKRWDLDRLLREIDTVPLPEADVPVVAVGVRPPPRPAPSAALVTEIDRVLHGMSRFIKSHTTLERDDRLWPGGADIFNTNPLQLQYGAAGTAIFLGRVDGEVGAPCLDWIVDHLDTKRTPPSLFGGLSGIAVSLLELGREEAARHALDAASASPLRLERAELYSGAAGWGLANLHFHQRLGGGAYLDRALEAGQYLLDSQRFRAEGGYWELENAGIPLGFGHGQSGVATFLIYLDALAPGQGFLEAAIAAIDFEIEHRQQLDDEVLWYPHVDAPSNAPKSPHMRHGSSGVGTAVLRGWAATGEERLRRFADVCALTISNRQTNKLWFDYGLAGYGEYMLDMHYFTGDELYLNNAYYLAEAILPFRIEREDGVAFPSEDLMRISTDFSSGMAGIGLFLHRLSHHQEPRFLLLDELLARPGVEGEEEKPATKAEALAVSAA